MSSSASVPSHLTGWLWLDPLLALLVASNIVWTGWQLVRRSASGLMDEALPADQQAAVVAVLERHRAGGIDFTPCAPGRLARVVSSGSSPSRSLERATRS